MSDSGTPPGGGKRTAGTASMDPLIGRILLDRYEVLRKVGSGGMGAVYVGRQLAVGREIALKVLRADLLSNEHVRERFRREAAIIGRLRHPNTIQLIDYGETEDGLAVMVCELLVGIVLSDRLKQHGPLPPMQAVEVCRQVASSLAEAHGLGMVHRDLKPANIFLVEVAGKTHAKVLDFGIARMLDEESTRITSTGQVFGTPRYMSPEQGTATGEVDHRADIYSLGLILYECLVGQPPFVANTSIQYLSAHMTQPAPHLHDAMPDAPVELDRLIDSCLVKDREQRVQTADDVEALLRRISIGMETGTIPGGNVPLDPTMPPQSMRSASSMTGPRSAPSGPATRLPDGHTAGEITGGPSVVRKPGPPVALIAGIAVVLLGIAGGAWAWLRAQDQAVAPLSIDAGPSLAALHVYPDAAPAIAPSAAPDAGEAVALGEVPDAGDEIPPPVDAGSSAAPDARTAVADGTPRRRDAGPRGSHSGNPSHVDGISGPRGMVIQTGGDDDKEIQLAKTCQAGWSGAGEAKLTLTSCSKDCAVLIEGACVGRTPVTEVAAPVGNKSLVVVCGSRKTVDKIAKLRAGETTKMSCK